MTGPTHRIYSILFSFIAVMLIRVMGITQINYYLTLIIILCVARRGAIFPDLDHNWKNVGEKTLPNKIINTLIHVTGGKHRSWQTHSIDICLIFTVLSYYLPNKLYTFGLISEVNKEVAIIIFIGFASGWISHIFSDMLNGAGVRLFCWLNKPKVAFVPKKLGKIRFNTGNEWEAFNYKVINIMNKMVGFICLIYPIIEDVERLKNSAIVQWILNLQI